MLRLIGTPRRNPWASLGRGRGGAYYPAFMDLVRSELSERYSNTDLRSQGLRFLPP